MKEDKAKQKEEIILLRDAGYSFAEIASKFGISRQRVHKTYTNYISPCQKPIPPEKHKKWTSKKREALPELFEKYVSERTNIIEPEKLKTMCARKREYLGLPTSRIQMTGSRNFTREIVRRRDNHTCQRCFKVWKLGERRFDVHHLDEAMLGKTREKIALKYDRENMDKLITFCHKCHFQWHKEAGHTENWNRGKNLTKV